MTKTAIILAAGKGVRLSHLTSTLPKCLLKIHGQETFLSYMLQNLLKVGVKKVIIVAGYQSDKIHKYLAQHNFPVEIDVVVNHKYETSGPLVSLSMGLESIKSSCWILPCDVIFDAELLKLVNTLSENECQLLAVKRKHYDDDSMKIRVNRSQVRQISKDIHQHRSVLESTGIVLLSNKGRKHLLKICYQQLEVNANSWYHTAIETMALTNEKVKVVPSKIHFWTEIDWLHQYDAYQKNYV